MKPIDQLCAKLNITTERQLFLSLQYALKLKPEFFFMKQQGRTEV